MEGSYAVKIRRRSSSSREHGGPIQESEMVSQLRIPLTDCRVGGVIHEQHELRGCAFFRRERDAMSSSTSDRKACTAAAYQTRTSRIPESALAHRADSCSQVTRSSADLIPQVEGLQLLIPAQCLLL